MQKTIAALALFGIVVTCQIDTERFTVETFQVEGPVLYGGLCMYFHDTKGLLEKACDMPCVVEDGTLFPAGHDFTGDLDHLLPPDVNSPDTPADPGDMIREPEGK